MREKRSARSTHNPVQLELFDYRLPLPRNGQLNLDLEEVLADHERLAQRVVILAKAFPSGVVHSSTLRKHLVEEGRLTESHADTNRLYRVFIRSGEFDRIAHGVYRLRSENGFLQPEGDLDDEQYALLRQLRSGSSTSPGSST